METTSSDDREQSTSKTSELSNNAALVYEAEFVPAIFAAWAERIAKLAGMAPGQQVLDVGCGTGVLARAAVERVGDASLVCGVDLNDSMLHVARELTPAIDWRQSDAAKLPFADESYNVVVSQFMLMFAPDPTAVLRELWRVLSTGGTLAVAVWSESGIYSDLAKFAREHDLVDVAESFESFFTLADKRALGVLLDDAEVSPYDIETHKGVVEFASIEDFIRVEFSGWTLSDAVDDVAIRLLEDKAATVLADFTNQQMGVSFPMDAHVVIAHKP